MSSKISTVFDAISTNMAALFTTKTRIPFPESLADNAEIFLRNGYGIRFDGSNLSEGEFCNYNIDYSFTIILTQEFFDNESNYLTDDSSKKSILEDVYSIQKDFYNVDKIGLASSCEKIFLGSVGPLQSVEDKRHVRFIEINLIFTIKESF